MPLDRSLSGSRSDLFGFGEPGAQTGFKEEEGAQGPILLSDVVDGASFVDTGGNQSPEDEHLTTTERLAVVVLTLQMGATIQNEGCTHDRRWA